jgi:hypothetical protein
MNDQAKFEAGKMIERINDECKKDGASPIR